MLVLLAATNQTRLWVDGLFSPDVQLEFTIYLLICNFLALQTEFEDSKNSVRSLLQFVKTKIF
jgi:hypothetical protein